ncbi:MAG: DUF547 domain-containing protein [Phenylobacterium sp.]|uniref:DUF547 domain-containing protein n=1 Tax=Phenylobacterium sp. TaxID=1871053 RepID=UPI0025E9B796|nr:DUF547 domain-containing protein [Phenylobacterium sp.]MBI1196241.1 DUF547 domain-containing protein [Phenylobacterium sp.]
MNRRNLIGMAASILAVEPGPAAAQGAPAAASGKSGPDHGAFDRLLGRYVLTYADRINRVDYRAWRDNAADRSALAAYLRALQGTSPRTLAPNEQVAFWSNLYNAETLRVVLDAYPVSSILSIRPTLVSFGPWKAKTLRVDGADLSLDEVENRILRPVFGDPMIHYALNCASISCPNLRPRAWRGATLAADLERAARDYINHPRGVRTASKGLVLSSIYKWYRADFGDSDAAILKHLARFAAPSLRAVLDARPPIAGYAYDWDLNAPGKA